MQTDKPNKRKDRDALEAIGQLEIVFPGVIALANAKSMDTAIYQARKPPQHLLEAAALLLTKGMYVAEPRRRKA